jgi:DNA-binding transcriptional MerR regulator
MSNESQDLTLTELAAESGVPGRTIRFYISRGLLPGPGKAGRGATYGAGHLARLREIAGLQANGLTLAEIAGRLGGGMDRAARLEPVAWWEYRIADDVSVQVRADASPWRLRQIRAHAAELAASLRQKESEE